MIKNGSTKSTNTHLLQRPGLVSSRYFDVQTVNRTPEVTSFYLSPGPQSTQIKAKQNDNADIEKRLITMVVKKNTNGVRGHINDANHVRILDFIQRCPLHMGLTM